MKKCPVLFLITAYLSGFVGIFFSLYLNLHRSTFQEFVQKSDTSTQEILFFSEPDFSQINWTEKGREFEWKDKMYDVSTIRKTKEGYLVFCLNDDEEEGFIRLFDTWKKSNSSGNNNKFQ